MSEAAAADAAPETESPADEPPPAGEEHLAAEPIAAPRKSWLLRYRRVMLALAGGAIAALATPPIDFYPGMLLGLLLLAAAIRDAPGVWRGFGLGALWGSAGGLVAMRFVPSVISLFTDLGTGLAWLAHVLLSGAQSLHWALGMALAVLLRRRLRAPLAFAFPVGVMVALLMPGVFIWSPAGLMSPWPELLQSAEWVGERGVSALLALIVVLWLNAALAARRDGYRARSSWLPAALGTALLAGMYLHGRIRMAAFADTSERARVGLVQAAIHPKRRWQRAEWPHILHELRQHTAAAEREKVALTVWPEAAYPYPLRHDAKRMPPGRQTILGGPINGPVLFGLITRAPLKRHPDGSVEKNSYNSATIVGRDGRVQPSYDKMELLLFGEAVPLADELPWLRRTFQRSGGLIPGNEIRPLIAERDGQSPIRIAVMNCYEDTIPELGRQVLNRVRPDLLVNVTNDAWFMGTEEPELHLRLAVMRSIELRRDTVRAVNLGVSGWIDAAGRVRLRSDPDRPGFVIAEPSLRNDDPTLYARYGDTPMLALFMAGALILVRRKRFLEATEEESQNA